VQAVEHRVEEAPVVLDVLAGRLLVEEQSADLGRLGHPGDVLGRPGARPVVVGGADADHGTAVVAYRVAEVGAGSAGQDR
jgi:hypothetical protein